MTTTAKPPVGTVKRAPHLIATLLLAWAASATPARAGVFGENDLIMVQAAPDVIHFQKSDEHVSTSWLVGAEWENAKRWNVGYSYFKNSFGQMCHYAYGGKSWALESISPKVYLKVTAGVIVGYKDKYEDKIPFNHNGVAPGLIPGIGYKHDRFNAQVNLLGTAGLMITVGYDLFR